jgi:hypothetical protein
VSTESESEALEAKAADTEARIRTLVAKFTEDLEQILSA